MITIIDYGMGNLKSLANAFQFLGVKVRCSSSLGQIERAEKLVFPGVGNFGTAMRILNQRKLDLVMKKAIQRGIPFLGICLGLQLLFQKSQEAPGVKGLGIFAGEVERFRNIKTPHMGWNQVGADPKSSLFKRIPSNRFFYFMHSFYVVPSRAEIISGITQYGVQFCSAVESKNTFGIQFHPEKSGTDGLKIIKNFIALS